MDFKQFATVSWDYEDVEFISERELSLEEAEQFLKDNEKKIVEYLCRVGVDFLEQLWNEQHPED